MLILRIHWVPRHDSTNGATLDCVRGPAAIRWLWADAARAAETRRWCAGLVFRVFKIGFFPSFWDSSGAGRSPCRGNREERKEPVIFWSFYCSTGRHATVNGRLDGATLDLPRCEHRTGGAMIDTDHDIRSEDSRCLHATCAERPGEQLRLLQRRVEPGPKRVTYRRY
jgi:hypothetical protein